MKSRTVSDEVGAYSFHNLPPGHYTVKAQGLSGFALFRIANLAFISGGRLRRMGTFHSARSCCIPS